ncbi:RNA polymerase sigma factor [Sphingopyxis sp. H115]|uniref:RNA polymerase sigma factor n=1 Tax=Sphingopyxis sp. H115 TaxID=1759073 RepID=UPI000B12D45E|nr:RNA polymerase sigma factor [Sphingopyxis sp. H115]
MSHSDRLLDNGIRVAAPNEADKQDWRAVQVALVRYIRARGARTDVAEDIAQETIARLIVVHRDKRIASVFALGFRIADNLLVDHYRADSRLADEPEVDVVSEAPSLDRALDSQRAVEVFQRCLNRMPRLRREVLIRRRLQQESCRVIGEELSISTKAVEKHITRGLIDLRRAMERAGIDPAVWNA